MFISYVAFLALLFVQGWCSCDITINDTDETGNVSVVIKTCEMGNCIENKCVCHDGWIGDLCDHCGGRIILEESSDVESMHKEPLVPAGTVSVCTVFFVVLNCFLSLWFKSVLGFVSDGPKNYSHRSKCSWLIQPSNPATSLRLSFLEFATECGWDHLYIYDGDSAFSPLIGSFNGLLHVQGFTNRPMPEIVAKSGKAFLCFYSDVAYAMLGFNISYSVDKCQNDCYGEGSCSGGECQCDGEREGQLCNLCPSNCSQAQTVECQSNEAMDCNEPSSNGVWSVTEFNSSVVPARASSALSLLNNTIWMYGGLEFGIQSSTSSSLSVFNTSANTWEIYEPSLQRNITPEARYKHTMVTWDEKLIVFGGKLIRDERAVNEMWEYDLRQNQWIRVFYSADFGHSVTNDTAAMSRLILSGHTADLVTFENGSQIMVVLFGYHPTMACTRFIYEYNPETLLWTMPRPSGVAVPGLLGHTTAYDPFTKKLYIHGGYKLDQTRMVLTSNTYLYDPANRKFSTLRSSEMPRYLHSASFFNGVMYIYGGNTHSTQAENGEALCYSSNVMAYIVACDKWVALPSPPSSLHPYRYGHKSVAVSPDDSDSGGIYIFSGYDSTMISNMLFYQPPTCSQFSSNISMCEDSLNFGISCSWNGANCLSSSQDEMPTCPETDDSSFCTTSPFNNSCADCVSNAYGCSYCSSACAPSSGTCSTNACEPLSDSYCASLVTCQQCETSGWDCTWRSNSCVTKAGNFTLGDPASCTVGRAAHGLCSSATSCDSCEKSSGCMWCMNPEKCVPSFSYVPQFPYGQCMEWTNNDECRDAKCSSQKTCSDCQKHAKCGWCDNGSLTGLGRCIEGSETGPIVLNNTTDQYEVNNQVCASSYWFFTSCPGCQCNGHSTCDVKDQCVDCKDHTGGSQCSICDDGYFGNPLNGGNCSSCQCEGKADTCQSSGDCNCLTKGVIGFSCDKCDEQSNYKGNATGNGTCFYPLLVNYVYTFNLVVSNDKYITAINFQNTPLLNEDVRMSLSSKLPCNVRVAVIPTAFGTNATENTLGEFFSVTSLEFQISASGSNFGDASVNSTIRVYVYNFTFPNTIKVSLLQRSNLLLTVLLILFSSFLGIVLFAAVGWKLKLLYDAHRQRANRAIQMKEMAARPFASIHLSCDDVYRSTQSLLVPGTQGYSLGEDQTPEAFCEEKCGDENASVLSVFLWLPSSTPNEKTVQDNASSHSSSSSMDCYVTPPPGQTALAIGTILSSGTPVPSPQNDRRKDGVSQNSRTDELSSVYQNEPSVVRAYDNHAMQHVQV